MPQRKVNSKEHHYTCCFHRIYQSTLVDISLIPGLHFSLVLSLHFPGSLFDYGFSCLYWTRLLTHDTVFKIIGKIPVSFTSIHCPHTECTWFLTRTSSPIRLRVPSLDSLIPPQFSSPQFDLETHYYELNRSVLKVPSMSGTFWKAFYMGYTMKNKSRQNN